MCILYCECLSGYKLDTISYPSLHAKKVAVKARGMRVSVCEMNDSVNNRYKSEGDNSPSTSRTERQTVILITPGDYRNALIALRAI